MQPVADRPLTISPELLVQLLQQAGAQAATPTDTFAPDAVAKDSLTQRAVAGTLSVAGIAAAGACLSYLRAPETREARRANAMAWAVAAPAVWAGVHLMTPSHAATADDLAAVGVGIAVFAVVCLVLRNGRGGPAARFTTANKAAAVVAGAAIGMIWHAAVLPNVGFSSPTI